MSEKKLTSPDAVDERISEFDNFAKTPNEDNFKTLSEFGEKSELVRFRSIYYYWVLSELMTPSHKITVSEEVVEEARKYLSENCSLLGESLFVVLSKHENPWRRWTAAKVIGYYGNAEALSILKKCLETELDPIVISYIEEAIDDVEKRVENGDIKTGDRKAPG